MNEEWLVKAEQYLLNEMPATEKALFEQQLSADEELREFFLLYQSINNQMATAVSNAPNENELKHTLQGLNTTYFAAATPVVTIAEKVKTREYYIKKWVPYAVAASLLVAVAVYLLAPSSPQQLADKYVSGNLSYISQTMGADSLQQGIQAFNEKHYSQAIQTFSLLLQQGMYDSDLQKFLGMAYLQNKDFDNALQHFAALAAMQNLQSNPGLFLQAVTLLQRNNKGDAVKARTLLEAVVKGNLEGRPEAEQWLKKL